MAVKKCQAKVYVQYITPSRCDAHGNSKVAYLANNNNKFKLTVKTVSFH